ncbi:hypothetical protein Palpr_0118 [Paludibacter propionicigenes WB4]|uniref:Uncharacterized protein n=1 Tax=Paludibacter propionicigenes (strain DSM 17365 / JCM 13257 / WB4) TaxID=694427 RepID=E4T090_PALPW|nr:hypothetical protein [Paludibacter propionicigenes]ADQ78280.1 hypothetical protein Palpr_0118 [Paludibacter propionicigenes WB4]
MEKDKLKEINLLQLIAMLFDWLGGLLKSVLEGLGYLLRLSYRHALITIIITGLAVGAGLFLSRPSARIYKAEAMAMIYGSEAQTVKEICKQLENSISTNNLYSLSATLQIPDSVARNIVQFQSFYVIDYLKDKIADRVDFDNNHPLTDTLNVRMTDRLYFRIKTKNTGQIPIVQKALLNYFNTNEVMKTQFENKKNELKQEIDICNAECKRIDSLAKVSYFKDVDKQIKFENNKLIVGEQKKQLFYDDLLNIHKAKSKAEIQYVNYKQPMALPSGFAVIQIPINGSVKYGVLGLLIGYLVSLIVSALFENRKKIAKYLNRK